MTVAFLILASGRIAPELQSDFGDTLGALVPIAGKSALTHILNRIKPNARIVVTVDESDQLVPHVVAESGHEALLVRCGTGQPLERAVVVGLAALQQRQTESPTSVTIIFSDTLAPLDLPPDSIAVAQLLHAQQFTTLSVAANGTLNYRPRGIPKSDAAASVGVFHVGDADLLRRCLEEVGVRSGQEPFYEALCFYHARRRLSLSSTIGWRDLGHLRNYYNARELGFQSRAFNEIRQVAPGVIRKQSRNREKISREVEWFSSLPPSLATCTPRLLNSMVEAQPAWYEIEHVSLPTVAEQLVWGNLPESFWGEYFQALDGLLGSFTDHRDNRIGPRVQRAVKEDVYYDKTKERLERFLESEVGLFFRTPWRFGETLLPPLDRVLHRALARAADLDVAAPGIWAPIHGDLFPGNMFFDRRAGRLLVIDPRGSFGMPGVFGDPAYDLAKMSHSFIGRYDVILAGLFAATFQTGNLNVKLVPYAQQTVVEAMFSTWLPKWCDRLAISVRAVRLIEGLLFLGMLPLHSEAPMRQFAFIGQALQALDAAGVDLNP